MWVDIMSDGWKVPSTISFLFLILLTSTLKDFVTFLMNKFLQKVDDLKAVGKEQ